MIWRTQSHCQQFVCVQLDEDAHCSRLTSQSAISSHLFASLEHVMNVMAYHPKYLQCFQRTHYYLMHEDGSLPFDYRHYIAIMVSTQCCHLYTCLLFLSIQNCSSLLTNSSLHNLYLMTAVLFWSHCLVFISSVLGFRVAYTVDKGWPDGRVVSVLDSVAIRLGFKSQL